MELRHLRYFVTIAEEQNFRRAATRLHVSQSPLSRQMKDLEEEMGVELFAPEGRGIKLTAAGKVFAERARSILASVDTAVDEAKGIAEGRLGTVVIGFETGTTFMGALLSLVAAFRRRTPRVGLQLVPMSSLEQWMALRQGTITVGYGAYAPSDDALGHLEMSRDRLGLLLSPEHRLARLEKIRLRDLESERVLLQPRQLYPRLHADIITAACTQGVTLHVTAEVLDLEALLALVVIGDAITFLTEKFWEPASQASLLWRPVEDLHINLSEFVTWRAEDADAPVVRALIESAREVSPILQGAADRTCSSKAAKRKRRSKR
ncbi:LysR family transcriptional regulator [Stigmatella aurantiaca]|uniref:Transcriptional regulator, LysR family n=2 Tax=Stigmatella aurantiaca (strain DW4/3-1) TaxID=378806 RepID=E3FJM1_STIAD|nr:LysR family transcriptional regulator [Stigmatella aurantiaca]ADO71700.1 Transcriptional regulator, LysR family [Stigmatella aurantiaca DW4/3-1]